MAESPGPRNFKRFLRMQRELQTSVGAQAEEKAAGLITAENRNPSFNTRMWLRSLQQTNRALSDALSPSGDHPIGLMSATVDRTRGRASR